MQLNARYQKGDFAVLTLSIEPIENAGNNLG